MVPVHWQSRNGSILRFSEKVDPSVCCRKVAILELAFKGAKNRRSRSKMTQTTDPIRSRRTACSEQDRNY